MLQTESILSPEEITLCLVLHCMIENLAIWIEQIEILDGIQQNQ